jgi:hypothetical protein
MNKGTLRTNVFPEQSGAEFQDTQANFESRLQVLVKKYKSRSALMGRWKKKGWL